jgi:citrate synthase
MSEPITSAIGEMKNGEYNLRGTPISQLIGGSDFASALWLTWTGSEPTKDERVLIEACLVASVDHGAEPPSAHVARVVASCGKPLADAVAAGLLTLGPRHGNAASAASEWIRSAVKNGDSAESVVEAAIADKRRLPGIGHPEYDVDPRTVKLAALAKKHLASTAHVDFALHAAQVFTNQKKKPLPLNVDGMIGAIIADMGAPSELADALFLVGRSVGLVAHAREETSGSASYRRG